MYIAVLQHLSINKYYKYFGYAIISLFIREEKEAGSAPGTIFRTVVPGCADVFNSFRSGHF